MKLNFKPNQLVACIFIIAAGAYATWKAGWFLYDYFKLWQQTTSPAYQNILLAACAVQAIPTIALSLLRPSKTAMLEAPDNSWMEERFQKIENELGSFERDLLKANERVANFDVALALRPDPKENPKEEK